MIRSTSSPSMRRLWINACATPSTASQCVNRNASTAPRVSGPRSAVRRRLGGGADRPARLQPASFRHQGGSAPSRKPAPDDGVPRRDGSPPQAPGHVDHGLHFHQVSIAWRDAIRWPCHRINARPDAVATPLARRDKRGRPAQRRLRRLGRDSGPGVSSHGRRYGSAGNALLSAGNGSGGAASPIKPPHHDANDIGGLSFLSSGQDRHDATDRSRVRRKREPDAAAQTRADGWNRDGTGNSRKTAPTILNEIQQFSALQ